MSTRETVTQQFGRLLRHYRTEVMRTSGAVASKRWGISPRLLTSMENGENTSIDHWLRIWRDMGIEEQILAVTDTRASEFGEMAMSLTEDHPHGR